MRSFEQRNAVFKVNYFVDINPSVSAKPIWPAAWNQRVFIYKKCCCAQRN